MTAPGEVRKVVTVVFADLAGSTALAERLDSEALRQVMSIYFERMSSVLERHGGIVHEFIGDAIMAVFGIPTLHEDDALRAVTAAAEMRAALGELNGELESRWGVRLEIRTGVNTGEIVSGDPASGTAFLVGDAINIASRLEKGAEAGEILIGRGTYNVVRNAVRAEETEPRQVKGKAEPLVAYRLLEVLAGTPLVARRLDSPLVARQHELAILEEAFERVEQTRACRLLTVLGSAGVGKSRLTSELVDRVGARAHVVKGRCLPYGEGITFWPIAEIVREAAGISEEDTPDEARERIGGLLPHQGEEAELVVDGIARALGLSVAQAQPGEVFWAIRKLIEALAADRPLIVVLDDIHWAEPTFLDLIEYLGGFSTEAPIMVVALARLELLELRPNWTTALPNAESLTLRPLAEEDSRKLIDNLLEQANISEDVESRITAAAQGNPLFVEEMLRMLVDDGLVRRENAHWVPTEQIADVSVPPTIRALLAARLDRLEGGERAILERGAVIGEEFWPGAVTALSPDSMQEQVWTHLQALIRKELIKPGGSPFAGEDPFSFSHILIRDTAYEAILKRTRAELHESFAAWLEQRAGDRIAEYEEILAYHLEQAHAYRKALGNMESEAHELAVRAARFLSDAGRRAHARGDMQAAVKLYERSFVLDPAERTDRLAAALELGHALFEIGEFGRTEAVLSKVAEIASELGDRSFELRAQLACADLKAYTTSEGSLDELRELSEQAIPVLTDAGDDAALVKCWRYLATTDFFACRFGAATEALDRALDHAERTGDQQLVAEILPGLATALSLGPMPVEEAVGRVEVLLARFGQEPEANGPTALASLGTRAAVEAWGLAGLEAMRGRVAEARALCSNAKASFEEVGQRRRLADASLFAGMVEHLAGDPAAAERELRLAYDTLKAMGEKGVLSTVTAELAEVALLQGRAAEAQRLTEESELLAVENDVESQVRWRMTRAKLDAARGDLESGETLARDAVERASAAEFPNLQAAASMALAEVLLVSDRRDEAADAAMSALRLYEEKGNRLSATEAKTLLAEI
jgi:predicted ATPase/class 3 adenylate cyclase